jgi:DHA3 family macrolide efflux protein-like MFS transporter
MWATLKNRDFSIFVFSQTISQFGDKLDYMALIGVIGLYPASRTPFMLSQLMLFMTLPVLVFGPIAGVLVDRWHKKKVMVVCDAMRMVCALMIPIMFLITRNIYPVYAVVFFMFLFTLFFNSARSAIIPNLVPRGVILKANSVINFIGRVATFLGMLVGGLIVDWHIWPGLIGMAGWTVAFILDAITFGTSAVMLYIMKVKLREPPEPEAHLEARGFVLLISDGLKRMWNELRHAVQMIFREKNLGFAMATIVLMTIAGSIIFVLIIPTVQKEMAWGTSGVGILAAIGAVGLLAGAWFIGVFGHRFDLKRVIVICFVVVGGVLILFPFMGERRQLIAAVFVAGFAVSPVFIGQDTLIHRYADEFVRGRMFSLRDWILSCLMALGSLLVGFLATVTTKDVMLIFFGIVIAVLAVSGWFIFTCEKSHETAGSGKSGS